MSHSPETRSDAQLAAAGTPRLSRVADWALHEYSVCSSTNLVAAGLPAWSAVRADTQTAGRGRFERRWVSDAGGLWLSAVLPVTVNSPAWRLLPLAIGLAVCDALGQFGVGSLRLRWPNDVLVGRRKLAGLLIDQFSPGLAVAGMGINLNNHPETGDGLLAGQTARLADLVSTTPSMPELTERVLSAVRGVWRQLSEQGPDSLVARLNPLWQAPRPVKLDLDGREVHGQFAGVDRDGRLELRSPDQPPRFFEPQQVRCLREAE